MFRFVLKDKKFLANYPNGEVRELVPQEIDSFYERINSVIETLDLKSEYFKLKEEMNISLIDFALEKDIDLDACLYAVLSKFRIEKPVS